MPTQAASRKKKCSDTIRGLSFWPSGLCCQLCWLYFQVMRVPYKVAAALSGFYHYSSKSSRRLLPSSVSQKNNLGTGSDCTSRVMSLSLWPREWTGSLTELELATGLPYQVLSMAKDIRYSYSERNGYCVSNTIDVHARLELSKTGNLTL